MKNKAQLVLLIIVTMLLITSCTRQSSNQVIETVKSNEPLETVDSSNPSVQPLVEEVSTEASDDISSVISESQLVLQERTISRCKQLVKAFNGKTQVTSGWIQIVTEVKQYDDSTGTYLEPQILEHWYQLDPEGYVVEGYGWTSYGDGEVVQEYVYLNGWYDEVYYNNWFNLEYDFDEEGAIQRPHSTVEESLALIYPDFCSLMDGSGMAWLSAGEFGGHPAIQFAYVRTVPGLYDGDPLIESIYFDQENFQLLGLDTWWVQPNGNLKNLQSTIYPTIEFDATPPEARFAEIWARVPHGETFVPLAEGE